MPTSPATPAPSPPHRATPGVSRFVADWFAMNSCRAMLEPLLYPMLHPPDERAPHQNHFLSCFPKKIRSRLYFSLDFLLISATLTLVSNCVLAVFGRHSHLNLFV